MQKDNKQTKSYWLEFENFSSNSTLIENIQTEVCIVGAGIAGMTTAYLLTKQGKDVVVVDMKSIAKGETCRTTAQITSELDERYYNLESIHGLDNTKLVAESQKKALDKIEEIVKIENIDCDFERVNAYLFTPPGEDYSELSKEFEACKKVDIPATLNDTSPVKSFNMGKNLCFTNQAQFNPLKYLQGLEKAILQNGGRIFTNTKIRDIKNGEIITITTENNDQ
ncbi:MAG: FAD-binding oxidoreductase, partial [Candidatus Sericytochromatia bacterium]|nr:FAD-binding oxidoreductase [Candidatus Sericytochromatia bacterium]